MSRRQSGIEFNLLRTQLCEIFGALQNMLTGILIRDDIRVSKKLGQFRSILCEVREPSFIPKFKSTRLTKIRRILQREIKFIADSSLDSFN
ncbi:hypothetical protein CEXT_251971 [Caerostris extrusa]|uniref:Uncharacterized protein n=1 Tax=Caerostris extrusa TaxID=172846 RepID=A0AAV4TPR0_CAEEX|nr:hypothetical protein CEXT_251971 [Caerostris extrusa]